MKEIILYSLEYDEFMVLEAVGAGVGVSASAEMLEILKENMRKGIGAIFVADWILMGEL